MAATALITARPEVRLPMVLVLFDLAGGHPATPINMAALAAVARLGLTAMAVTPQARQQVMLPAAGAAPMVVVMVRLAQQTQPVASVARHATERLAAQAAPQAVMAPMDQMDLAGAAQIAHQRLVHMVGAMARKIASGRTIAAAAMTATALGQAAVEDQAARPMAADRAALAAMREDMVAAAVAAARSARMPPQMRVARARRASLLLNTCRPPARQNAKS